MCQIKKKWFVFILMDVFYGLLTISFGYGMLVSWPFDYFGITQQRNIERIDVLSFF